MNFRSTLFSCLLLTLVPLGGFTQCYAPWKVLHYTETTGFNHNTKTQSLGMFNSWASTYNFTVTNDDDGSEFNTLANLQQYAIVVFSNTSGDKGLDATQRANFEAYINGGGSYLGIHAASDTYRHGSANGGAKGKWDWYAENVSGATVQQYPNHTNKNHNNDMTHQSVGHPTLGSLPDPWNKTEEYYYWENGYLAPGFTELLRVGQTGSKSFDAPRMMAQCKDLPGGGRTFYTALGHDQQNYTSSANINFQNLIRDALIWAATPNLTSSSTMVTTATIVADTCSNSTGEIDLSVSGGSSPYTFSWSNGATSEDLTGLASGEYIVTVTDASGCTHLDTFTVTEANTPWKVLHYTETTGFNHNTKSQSLGMFNSWASTYNFTVTNDDDGSEFNTLANLQQYAVVVFSNTSGDKGLDATQRANFEAYIAGGGSYLGIHAASDTYRHGSANGGAKGKWDWYAETVSGATVQQFPNHTNQNHNNDMTHQSVGHPTLASLPDPWNKTEEYYYWENGYLAPGFIELLRVGWTGSNSRDAPRMMAHCKDLPGGGRTFYTALGHDKLNYTSSANINFQNLIRDALLWTAEPNICGSTSAPTIQLSGSVTDDTCSQSSGAIDLTVSGGSAPYSYSWSNGATSEDVSSLTSGTYSVTVTDNTGASGSTSFTVNDVSVSISINVTETTEITCPGGSDGVLTASASGGTAPYSYQWSSGDNTAAASGLAEGTYTVVVTDAKGCQDSTTFTINAPQAWVLNVTETIPISCPGGSDGELTALVSGGNGGNSFSWNTGSTSQTASGLSKGSYSVTVTDSKGCTVSGSGSIDDPEEIEISFSETNETCPGAADGMITTTVTGGNPGYSYSWNTGSTATGLSGIGAGTYILTVTDGNSCVGVDSTTISAPDTLFAGIDTLQPLLCAGVNTAILSATSSGGTGTITYVWSTGATTQQISGLGAGTFQVILTDANGCKDTATASMAAPASVIATAVVSDSIDCAGASTGELAVSATGGLPPYSYLWSTGATNDTISGLAAGNYAVEVTDQNGCQDSAFVTLTDPDPLIVTASVVSDPLCPGDLNGVALASASGGAAPYSFLWDSGQMTDSLKNQGAGSYQVVVTDAKGCEDSATVTLTDPDTLNGSLQILASITCEGGSNGAILASATGGIGGYTYTWADGPTGSSRTGLSAGSYTVYITDTNGCADTVSVTLNDGSPIVVTISQTAAVSCFGQSDGALLATPSGTTGSLSYLWNTGATGNAISNIGAGTYIVTLTDGNGCQALDTFIVMAPAGVGVNASVQSDVTCFGASDGVAVAAGTGGTSPYTYSWSDGQTTATASGLSSGNYLVTVTDQNGCQDTASVVITQPDSIGVSISLTSGISCFGGADGELTASVMAGQGGITYTWSNGASGAVATGLVAGTYQVVATDAAGCQDSVSFTLSDPDSLQVSTAVETAISCFGEETGSIRPVVSGGTPAYSFTWDNGQTDSLAINLGAGSYLVTVTDANGCTDTSSLFVSEPADIVSSITQTADILCFGDSTAELSAGASGGTAPYTYLWSTGASGSTLSDLKIGTYEAYITDANGCQDTAQFTVTQPSAISVSAAMDQGVSCSGGNDGEATASASGATGAFTYLWSDGQTTATATGLSTGTYSVIVTDQNGCQDSATVTITAPASVIANISLQTAISCAGGTDGELSAGATGGTAPYSFVWSNTQTGATATGLSQGAYYVVATDQLGCTDSAFFTLTEPDSVEVMITLGTAISCNGAADGVLQASAIGGSGTYTYSWSSGASGALASGLIAGTYQVIATDANGCQGSVSFTLTEPSPVLVSILETNGISCFGATDGELTASATGGTAPYTYFWNNGSAGAVDSGLGVGAYSVIVSDANGCTDTAFYTLTGPSALSPTATVLNDVTCNTGMDGSASAAATGGTAPYSFLWSDGQTSQVATGLSAGGYTVIITDANGCQDSTVVTLAQPAAFNIQISQTASIACAGDSTASLNVSVTGGSGSLTYLWNTGSSSATISTLPAGIYQVVVTDSLGCQDSASFTITGPDPIIPSITTVQDISCAGDSDGALLASATGGAGNYAYSWSGGQSTASISGLSAGSYQVIVTDGNGCQDSTSAILSAPDTLVVTATVVTPVACFGASTGVLSASVVGGTSGYSYLWSSGQTGNVASGLPAGSYTLTVTDANGCTDIDTVSLAQPAVFTAAATEVTPATCNAAGDGKGVVTVSGGIAPFSYLWSNGQTTDTLQNVGPGSYSVIVTGQGGCTASSSVNISNVLPWTAQTVTVQDVSCYGGNDGILTEAILGGAGFGPFTFLWSDGQVTDTASNLSAGIYTVTITDASGCVQIVSDTITQPDQIQISLVNTTNVSCHGGNDGALTASASGGTGSLSFSWSNGQTGTSVTGLSAQAYILIVTDSLGCSRSDTFTISEPAPLSIGLTATDVTCFGAADGTVSSTVSGGTLPYGYLWSNGGTGTMVSALSPGTYQLVVTDGNGCKDSLSAPVTQPDSVIVTAVVVSSVTCFGGNDGAASASTTGGDGVYTYSWSNGATSSSQTGLPAGTYTVTVTDGNGCSDTDTVTITEPTDLVVSATVVSNALCAGGNTGKAYVTASGGTPGYTYLWTGGATGDTISSLSAGTYTVIVTDSNGCQDSASVTISQPSGLTVAIPLSSDVSCFGGNNGSATALASGGNGSYSYLWSNGAVTASISALTAGTYQVTATDGFGCTAQASIIIQQPDELVATATQTSAISCFGDSDGAVNTAVTGGTAPYAYFWSNGQNGTSISGLSAGAYLVIVTDANGCADTSSVTLSDPSQVAGAVTILNQVSCFGGNDGQVTVSATGGTGTLSYLWSNGATSQTDSTLNAGPGYVLITDNNGCQDSVAFILTEPADLVVSALPLSNVSCFGGTDGAAVASASGGTGPYSYAWSTGQTGVGITGLAAGTYTVVVTDVNGCQDSASVQVTEPAGMTLSMTTLAQVSCFGVADGSLSVSVSGGSNPYSYLWNTGDTTATSSGLTAGIYTVTVTDNNGCSQSLVDTLDQPAALIASISIITPISCADASDGALQVNTNGGTPPVGYLWNTGQTTALITSLDTGSYSVIVTDINGCKDTTSATLSQPAEITFGPPSVTDASCFGASDGAISVMASGGTGGFSYLWSNGQTGASISGLTAGNYQVIATDGTGCSDSLTVAISSPPVLTWISISTSSTSCAGGSDGQAAVTATGGTAPYTYSWSNGQTGSSVSGLSAGPAKVIVTDANGCQDSLTLTITEPAAISINFSGVSQISCSGGNDGTATATASGGLAPYSYSWSSGAATAAASGLSEGMAIVAVTDANGCTATDSVLIQGPAPVIAAISLVSQPLCISDPSGSLVASATGGTGSYSYSWSNGQNGDTATSLLAGTYIVTVTDGNGCQDTASFSLSDPSPIVLTPSVTNNVSCNAGNDGAAAVSASGGAGSFTYLWSGSQTGNAVSGLTAGTFTVVATDQNGCKDSATVTITEPSSLVLTATMTDSASCSGVADGSASVSVSGGTAPYSYLWDNGSTTAAATGLLAGSHTVVVTDANGCIDSASVVILQPQAITISFSVLQPVTCLGNTDGTIQATAIGGTGPYTYNWSTGANGAVLSNIGAGNFSVTATDQNGCSVTDTTTVSAPMALTVQISLASPITCPGGNDGGLTASPLGGAAPYSYSWSSGDTVALTFGLSAGTYSVLVTDANGCIASSSETLIDPASFSVEINLIDSISCYNAADGKLEALATGGVSPYQYTWSDGTLTSVNSSLDSGLFSVVVMDSKGCLDSASAYLPNPDSLFQTVTKLADISCAGAKDGQAVRIFGGGTAPLMISWSDGTLSDTLSQADAGMYIAIVEDARGCIVQDTVVFDEPDPIQLTSITLNNITCNGAADGAIIVTLSGGTGNLSGTWSNGATGFSLTGLSAGSYTLNVTDDNGCTLSQTFNVFEPNALDITLNAGNLPQCFGDNAGSVSAVVSGGLSPYTYAWSNGATGSQLTNVGAGTYTVVVTDQSGCQDSSTFVMNEPDSLSAVIAVLQDINCAGDSTGSIEALVSGGTAPYSYSWNGQSGAATLSSLPSGTYSLVVTDANGCTDTASVMLSAPDQLQLQSILLTNVSCFDGNDGALDILVSGGTGALSYSWNTGQTGGSISGLFAGSYTLTVTDSNGCQLVNTFQINEPAAIGLALSVDAEPLCFGDLSGSISSSLSGGVPPFSYAWSNGSTNDSLLNAPVGTYTLIVTDGNGCQDTSTAIINGPDSLSAVIAVLQNINCAGDSTGSIEALVSGGTAPYSYSWNGQSGAATLSSLPSGTYSLVVTDANGCTDTASVMLSAPDQLQLQSILLTNVSCFDGNDGALDILVSGGTGALSYSWNTGQTGGSISGLFAGSYTLTVTDSNGCQLVNTFQINEPAAIGLALSVDAEPLCFGDLSGSISSSLSGGVPPFSYAWSNGSTNDSLLNAPAGTYTLIVTDGNGCQDTSTVIINGPDSLSAVIAVLQDINCAGDSTGSIEALVSGGTAPYSYSWNGQGGAATLSSLPSGTYSLVVTDANGCTDTASVMLSAPDQLQLQSILLTNVSCFDGNDGALDILVSGGTGALSYSWNTGQTGGSISGLFAGSYTLTVTDSNGCQLVNTFQINEPAAIGLALSVDAEPLCFGDLSGSISSSLSGGVPPFSYAWSNGSTNDSLLNAPAGTYTLIVTDGNGCQDTSTAIINGPDSLSAVIAILQDINCAGDSTGSIEALVSGGTAPYSYSWNGQSGAATLSSLPSGTYSLVVTDANGCTDTASVMLSAPDQLQLQSILLTNVSCFDGNDGALDILVSGGTGALSYSWNTGQTGGSISGLFAGSYTLTVTDSNGCQLVNTFQINEPAAIGLALSVDAEPLCFGDLSGSISSSMSGGVPPFSYAWSNGSTNDSLLNVSAGTYTLIVTDGNGCQDTSTAIINGPDSLSAVIAVLQDINCAGDSTGSIEALVSGGAAPYSYSWNGQSGAATLSSLPSGTYSLVVTDANGCTDTASVMLSAPDQLQLQSILLTNVSCFDGNDGALDILVSGGTGALSYSWNTGQTGGSISGLFAGSYTLTVTDSNGCQLVNTFQINEPAAIGLALSVDAEPLCFGDLSGSISSSLSGGVPPFSYAWSNGSTNDSLLNAPAGTYTLIVTDGNGCQDTSTAIINGPDSLSAVIAVLQDINCAGDSTGSIEALVSGGTAPYSYSWNGQSGAATLSSLPSGTYSLVVTDANGCTDTASVMLSAPDQLQLQSILLTNVSCFDGNDGALDILVSGGTGALSYSWNTGQTGGSISGLFAGSYTLTVTDSNGCQLVNTFQINEPAAIGLALSVDAEPLCFGDLSGSISSSMSGGVPPFSYAWSNGSTNDSLLNVSAGTYTLIVTDGNGCQDTSTAIINGPDSLSAVIAVLQDINCAGDSTGSIEALVSGGAAPYSYSWNGQSGAATLSSLPSGTYSLVVTDANGCTDTASVMLSAPDQLQLQSILLTNVSCFDGNDGALDILVSGGTGALSYSWNTGQTGGSISGLFAGSYTLTVTDSNGCQLVNTFQINEPAAIGLALSVDAEPLCFGDLSGSISSSLSGGVPPFSYAWSNGSTNDSLLNAPAGTYTLIVTDGNGCQDTSTAIINGPDSLSAVIAVLQDINCAGDSTGSIEALVSGGTAPYSYSWNGQSGAATLSSLPSGTYSLVVTDANGCTDTASVMLSAPDQLQLQSILLTNVSCFDGNDGALDILVSGGTGALSYSWNTGQTGGSISGLFAGSYTLTVTDSNGCQLVNTFQINEPAAIGLALSVDAEPLCFGDLSGSISSNLSGGVPPFSYAWSNGSTNDSLLNAPAGTYTLIVTDGNGCQDTSTAIINGPDSLSAVIAVLQDITCAGDSAAIEALVSGGTPGYTYSWNGQAGGPILNNIPGGSYQLMVTDLNGCTDTATISIAEPLPLIANATITNPLTCAGDANGVAVASASGGIPPYSFAWDNGGLTDTISSLVAGTYTVIVTDSLGCTDTQTVTLVSPQPMITTISVVQEISCFGESDGELEVNVSGGATSYTYLWSNASTSNSISGLGAGSYSVLVEDGNGCLDSATFQLTEPDSLIGSAFVVQPIVCGGGANGILSTMISGGTLPYSTEWTPGGVTDSLFGVVPGLYEVVMTDANGCMVLDSITVTEPDTLVPGIEILEDITCFGDSSASLRAFASGGQIPYSWSWSNGAVGDTITGLPAGIYTAILTDSLGCVDSVSVTLEEPNELIVSLTTLQDASCDSAQNGQAVAELSGGTGPYTFTWSNGETQDTAFALSGGWQLFTGSDSLGCEVIDSVLIETRLSWAGEVAIIDTVTCFGAEDGMAEVQISGPGTFQYLWSNGEGTNPAISLGADTTFVVITDQDGCDTTMFVVMDQPADIIVLATVANTDPGLSNGAIRIDSVANGVGPFTYFWTNFATTEIISELDTGLYQVEVTDSRGCTGSGSYVVGENVLDWENFEAIQNCELGLVFLNWDVLEESGVEFFSIERSDDGLIYSRVAELPSEGDTVGLRSYTIPDTITPENTISYRIRGHFYNGNTMVTDPMDAFACIVDSGFVEVYPTPIVQGDQLTAVFQTIFVRETRVELRNALHQTLQFYDIPGPVGRQTVVFDTEELASGHYYVIVSNGAEAYSARVLVVD